MYRLSQFRFDKRGLISSDKSFFERCMTFGNLNESISNETIILIWIICGQFDICFSQVICKGISIKVFKVTVVNSLWVESSKAGFDKRCYKFVVITKPVSMTLLL